VFRRSCERRQRLGSVYTVTVNTGTGSGGLRLSGCWCNYHRLGRKPLSGLPYTSGESYSIDKTAPTVVQAYVPILILTAAASVDFTVTFSIGHGVDVSDFVLNTSGVSGRL